MIEGPRAAYSTQLRGYWLDTYKMCREIGAYLTGEARVFGNKKCKCWCILYNVRQEKGDGGGLKIAL
jgi:hypothetical protein